MTERAILLTGLGGQGIQLAARVLATAAAAEGLEAMVFGEYAGMMRGGNTDATVVLGTHHLTTPPTVSSAWGAVAMHHEFWPEIERKLTSGGVVIIDTSVFGAEIDRNDVSVVGVDATTTATDIGNPRAGSMVMLGALSAATGLIGTAALEKAVADVLPPYRAQFAAANAEAIRAGYRLVDEPIAVAWPAEEEALAQ